MFNAASQSNVQSHADPSLLKNESPLGWADHALLGCGILVLTVVLVLMMVPMLPTLFFDTDPRSNTAGLPMTVLGPTHSAWLAVLSMGLCAVVMVLHHLTGNKIGWISSLLVMAGMGVCWYHMGDSVESMHRSTLWAGAMALALAARHLADHDRIRRLFVASLLAMLVPMALQSILFVLVEHPATVEMFHETEDAFLKSRGWAEGSAQHLLYLRRLSFNDATGPFGLSNVYGSVLAALTLMGLVVSGHVYRQWRATWAMIPMVCVVLGLATIYLTHSKGAVAVLAAGVMICLAMLLVNRLSDRARLTLPLLALVLIAGASVAVIARGAVGGVPKTADGERSILFRYQYWQGATRVVTHMDRDAMLWGLGPGQFKQSYVIHKDPLNPEEVTSTHNVFLDQWISLGIGGICWSLILLGWVCKSGELAGEELTENPNPNALLSPKGVRDKTIILVCLLAILVFGSRFAIQGITLLTPEALLVFTGSAIAFIVLTSIFLSEGWLTNSAMRGGLFVAGATLLIHNQIEMTFFHEGACSVAMFMVGASGGGRLGQKNKKNNDGDKPFFLRLVMPVAMIALLVMTVQIAAKPMTKYQRYLAQAEKLLQAHQLKIDSNQLQKPEEFLKALGALEQANSIIPHSPRAWRWRVQLLAELVQGSIQSGQRSRALVLFEHMEKVSQQAIETCPNDLMLLRQIATLQVAAADWFHQPARKSLALSNWNLILQLNPHGLMDHLSYADLLWNLGRKRDAVRAYERVIMVNNQTYLDPDKQLKDSDRQRCLDRIKKGRSGK